jgi:purine-nucleoside phosphorylase
MATPHISAAPGDFAEAILLPGDPLRARHIAENFLEGAREVTAVRNMLGFTGTYRGMPVSVMGTGMGIPSASIYATELVKDYGVKRLVRVGSCGGVGEGIALRDVVLAAGACTDSQVNRARYGGQDFAAIADFDLLRSAAEAASAPASRSVSGTCTARSCSTTRVRRSSTCSGAWVCSPSRWRPRASTGSRRSSARVRSAS